MKKRLGFRSGVLRTGNKEGRRDENNNVMSDLGVPRCKLLVESGERNWGVYWVKRLFYDVRGSHLLRLRGEELTQPSREGLDECEGDVGLREMKGYEAAVVSVRTGNSRTCQEGLGTRKGKQEGQTFQEGGRMTS